MSEFLRKLRWQLKRAAKEEELREELQFHLDEERDALNAAGEDPDTARRAARRDLGNLTTVQEETRAAWTWQWLEDLAKDLRYGLRVMAASKSFSVLAVLSLALGIGASAVIFSFMDALLVRSLPVADPQRLVVFNWRLPGSGKRGSVMHSMSGTTWNDSTRMAAGIFPYPAYDMFRKNNVVLSTIFGHFQYWSARSLNVIVHGQAEVGAAWSITGDYFSGLGVQPAAGRLIGPADDQPATAAVAVLSYRYSRRRFGEAANAVGQSILLDNQPFTVVGVAPPEFFGVDPALTPDIYLPLRANDLLGTGKQFGFQPEAYLDPHYYWIQIMGRLRPGVTRAQAQSVLAEQFHQWVGGTATTASERANLPQLILTDGAGGLNTLRRRYSEPLLVLMAMVALILALACANVANLLLARADSRRGEISLRLGIGAGRFRIIRQLLAESLALSSAGGALGLAIALIGMRVLNVVLISGADEFAVHAEMNWRVLAAAAGVSILTGILFGLAPALQAARVDVVSALKSSRTGRRSPTRGFRKISFSRVLTVSQIGLALVMLVAAGLFVRTLAKLESLELGFDSGNLLVFRLDARKAGHKDPEIAAFYAQLGQQFRSIPGVRDVSLSEDPLVEAGTGLALNLADEPPDTQGRRILNVGPWFFKTMGIPILAGRDFEDSDRTGSPGVAVVNQAFVNTYLVGRNPLGQRLILWESGKKAKIAREMEIVGVCRNARYGSLTEEFKPIAFMPYDQGYPRPDSMVYELRTRDNPLSYEAAVRTIVRHADAHLPITELHSQSAIVRRQMSQEVVFARLCSGFAILALLIACVGLFGTISYSVGRRTGEIGIRMALGAERGRVMAMVLREVAVLVLLGLAIGFGVAFGASKLVKSFLYGIKPNDPAALAFAAAILLCAAITAGYLPARKASRIEPMAALRNE